MGRRHDPATNGTRHGARAPGSLRGVRALEAEGRALADGPGLGVPERPRRLRHALRSRLAGSGTTAVGGEEGGLTMQQWSYMTWRAEHLGGENARVRAVNGEEFDGKERPSFYEALARAGEDGWELVNVDANDGVLIFKRPVES